MQIKKINKKGDLVVEEALRIILAVIGIGFLIYLIISFAGIFYGNHQKEQAKATLDNIVSALNTLEEGKPKSVFLESPNNWYLFYFENVNDPLNSESSRQVSTKNHLCICDFGVSTRTIGYDDTPMGTYARSETIIIPKCSEKKGVCREVNSLIFSLINSEDKGIKVGSSKIYLYKSNGPIYITQLVQNQLINQLIFEEVFKADYSGETAEQILSKLISTRILFNEATSSSKETHRTFLERYSSQLDEVLNHELSKRDLKGFIDVRINPSQSSGAIGRLIYEYSSSGELKDQLSSENVYIYEFNKDMDIIRIRSFFINA